METQQIHEILSFKSAFEHFRYRVVQFRPRT